MCLRVFAGDSVVCMRRGIGMMLAWPSLAALIVVLTLTTPPAALGSESCSNEVRRVEQGSALPDCRAYELVTPPAKDSDEPLAVPLGFNAPELVGIKGAHAATTGERMAWESEYSLPGSSFAGLDYLSTRDADGWSTENVIPPQSVENGVLCPTLLSMVAWSTDLSKGVLADGDSQEGGTGAVNFYEQGFGCGHDEPRLVPGEREGFQNLFVRGSASRTYQLVNVTPTAAPVPEATKDLQDYFPANFLAGSADLSHVVFEEELPLTEEAEKLTPQVETACKNRESGCWEGHDELYEWSEVESPAVRFVSVLPNGMPVQGALAGATRNATRSFEPREPANTANVAHAISADGSRIFFEAEGRLYVRENGDRSQSALGPKGECTEPAEACTIQLDLPQGGSGPGGGGKFLAANAEGTKAYFTDGASAGLTSDTVAGSGANLYEYELPKEAVKSGSVIDLTPAPEADVLGLSGTDEDGAYVYFVAEGELAGSDRPNAQGVIAQSKQPNLYLFHEGVATFITTLAAQDSCDWASETQCESAGISGLPGLTARVSSNGSFVSFNSIDSLTGYDNTDSVTGNADDEIFLYEASSNALSCVSCYRGSAPSDGGAAIRTLAEPDSEGEHNNFYPQRNVSDAGQVFFETDEALLPQDTNGQRDVYEYEGGDLYLISGGTSEGGSFFLDATPSGSDLFFGTAQSLTRSDTDAAYDIYDARVGGGFPEPAEPAPSCGGETCRTATGAAASPFLMPASVSFTGAGNLAASATDATEKAKLHAAAVMRNQKFARALKACVRRRARRTRLKCERKVRAKYGRAARRASRDNHGGVK